MNLMVSWQLMLFICAISFRETLEKEAPMENPRSTDQKLGPLGSRRCAPGRPVLCAAGGRLMPREKDLSAYNWNSFGLRYGRRQAGARLGAQGPDTSPRTGRGAPGRRGAAGRGAEGGHLQSPS